MLTASNTLARLAARRGNHALDRDLYCDQASAAVIWKRSTTATGSSPCPPANWPRLGIVPPCRWALAFRAPSGARFDDQPGQFPTLDLPINPKIAPGGNVQRTCTTSPSPPAPLVAADHGEGAIRQSGTRWLLEHLKPGVKIRAIGPSGIFSFHRHHQESFQAPVATEAGAKPLNDVTPDAGARSGILFALSNVSVRCAETDTVLAMEPRRVHRRAKSVLAVACRLHPGLTGDHPDPVVAKVDQGSRRPPGGAGEMAGDVAERDDLR